MIDEWFLGKIQNIVDFELTITGKPLSRDTYICGKKMGFTDTALRRISGSMLPAPMAPLYRMVDTCAGEFAAKTPYYYAAYNTPEEGGAGEVSAENRSKKTVIVLGSGPIRIGQGIEFDYSSVHCVWELKNSATTWSSSTTTRKRSPRTSTRRTGCILSRSARTT
jgi:carbamoyl-phosphate synthase large subunit